MVCRRGKEENARKTPTEPAPQCGRGKEMAARECCFEGGARLIDPWWTSRIQSHGRWTRGDSEIFPQLSQRVFVDSMYMQAVAGIVGKAVSCDGRLVVNGVGNAVVHLRNAVERALLSTTASSLFAAADTLLLSRPAAVDIDALTE